jgi:hypothetical protein
VLLNEATAEGHEECIRLVQSARTEAALASHERGMKVKTARDELIQPHELDAED